MSIDEVASTLRISERGVYRLISSGQLISLKVGHRTLLEPAEVRNFIACQRQHGDQPRPERAA
jgi:excisionase family DNA binding protein